MLQGNMKCSGNSKIWFGCIQWKPPSLFGQNWAVRGTLLRLRGPLLIIGSIAENKNRLSLSGWEGVENFSCLNMIRRKTLNVKEVGLLWYSLTGQKEPAVHTALATVLDFQEEEVEKSNLIESLITEFCFFLWTVIFVY